MSSMKIAHFVRSVNKHGYHRNLVGIIYGMSSMKIAHFVSISQQTWLQMYHRNLVGSIYGMSSMKIVHFVPIGQQTWPPHAIFVSDWSISKKCSPQPYEPKLGRKHLHLYMYGRFCIKFPQSRMKDERHRLSPLSLQLFVQMLIVNQIKLEQSHLCFIKCHARLVLYCPTAEEL